MSRVSFHVEWHNAPGVRDQVLAQTWGRLTIRIDGTVVTRALDLKSNSERDGVYGPMFPLAEWLVENFWFLSNEIPRGKALSGRPVSRPQSSHRWMARHNFLAAGAGAALPNLTFAADSSEMCTAAWFPDPVQSERRTLRFLGEGRVNLPASDFEVSVTAFVNAVLAKVDGLEYADISRLRRDWEEVGKSMRAEATLCRQLAKVGLDPYDVDDEAIDKVERAIKSVPPNLQTDLLDSSSLEDLSASAAYAAGGSNAVQEQQGPKFRSAAEYARQNGGLAHEIGYSLAHEFRKTVGHPHDRGVPNLDGLMNENAFAIQSRTLESSRNTNVRGIVGFSPNHTAVLVTPKRSPETSRFLLGRALGAFLLGQCEQGPRLLTDAFTWEQAAARAFSAELLAPQAALAQRVRNVVDGDELRALATEFAVSDLVIAHQIENHELASIVPD